MMRDDPTYQEIELDVDPTEPDNDDDNDDNDELDISDIDMISLTPPPVSPSIASGISKDIGHWTTFAEKRRQRAPRREFRDLTSPETMEILRQRDNNNKRKEERKRLAEEKRILDAAKMIVVQRTQSRKRA